MTFLFSALGMWVGYMTAQLQWVKVSVAEAPHVITAQQIEIRSKDGKKQILLGTSGENSPAIWFFDAQGKSRMNMGLYGDGNAFIVLNDPQEQAVEIMRTVGAENSPYLIWKHASRDRMIMGLNYSTHDPFLVQYEAGGNMKMVFGKY